MMNLKLKALSLSLLVSSLAFLAPKAYAAPHSTENSSCQASCSSVVLYESGWHLITKDAMGEIWKVQPLDIPSDADLKPSNGLSKEQFSALSDSSQRTTQYSYETPTEVVVVTVIEFLDTGGNVFDVQVTVVRAMKKIEPLP